MAQLQRTRGRAPPVFSPTEWQSRVGYWLSNHEQGSPMWHKCRLFRLTASNSGTATGRGYKPRKGPPEENPFNLALTITKLVDKEFSAIARERMSLGTQREPLAREWYEKLRGVTVTEVGLAVPLWETRLGASVDGDLPEEGGIIEIKCPQRMYEPLTNFYQEYCQGVRRDPYYHEHIASYYYAQMQMNMKVTGRNWCDYVVYSVESNLVYCQRIPFNPSYWDNELYPDIQSFLNNILDPLIDMITTIAPDFDHLTMKWEDYVEQHGMPMAPGERGPSRRLDSLVLPPPGPYGRRPLDSVCKLLNSPAAWNPNSWTAMLVYLKFRFMVDTNMRSAMLYVVQSYIQIQSHDHFTLMIYNSQPILYRILYFLQNNDIWFTLPSNQWIPYARQYIN